MKEYQFNKSRFSKVMNWDTYHQLDRIVQDKQTLPDYAKVRTSAYFSSSKPTSLLTSIVILWMKSLGAYVYRQNTTGVLRKVNGEFRMTPISKFAKGQADIQGVFEGKALYIEIKAKATRDRMRPEQVKFKQAIEAAGGEDWIVGMVEDLLKYLN